MAPVEVPRAWDTFDESLRGFEGIGWYAVTLDGSWARAGKLQRLTFGRVMYHTKVWLNGEYLGEHIDGYLPFAFDVTGKLKASDEPAGAARRQPARGSSGCRRPSRSSGSSTAASSSRCGSRARGKIAIADLAIRAVPRGDGRLDHVHGRDRGSARTPEDLVLRAGRRGIRARRERCRSTVHAQVQVLSSRARP